MEKLARWFHFGKINRPIEKHGVRAEIGDSQEKKNTNKQSVNVQQEFNLTRNLISAA